MKRMVMIGGMVVLIFTALLIIMLLRQLTNLKTQIKTQAYPRQSAAGLDWLEK